MIGSEISRMTPRMLVHHIPACLHLYNTNVFALIKTHIESSVITVIF